jgi:hypothetical protein
MPTLTQKHTLCDDVHAANICDENSTTTHCVHQAYGCTVSAQPIARAWLDEQDPQEGESSMAEYLMTKEEVSNIFHSAYVA